MATFTVHTNNQPLAREGTQAGGNAEGLHNLRELALSDADFAAALANTATPEEAADLAARHDLRISPEALWRNRGRLMHDGKPTWRG